MASTPGPAPETEAYLARHYDRLMDEVEAGVATPFRIGRTVWRDCSMTGSTL